MSAGSAADTSSGVDRGKKKLVQVQRDHQRRTAFLERRRQAAAVAEEARIDKISAVRSGGNLLAHSVHETSSATSDDLQDKADGEDIIM